MSAMRFIDFSLPVIPKLDRIVAALREQGMEIKDGHSVQIEDEISYLITEENGDYAWKIEPIENRDRVFG